MLLFGADQKLLELERKLGSAESLRPLVNDLLKHGVLRAEGSGEATIYSIFAESKRPKRTFTRENSSADEVLKLYQKRRASARLKDSYKTHSGARGSEDSWREQAERLREALTGKRANPLAQLRLLGLAKMPDTLAGLDRARRKVMLTAHPDRGGSTKKAQAVNEAYEVLKRRL